MTKIPPNNAIRFQLIWLTENLSTIRPVNSGTNSPLKLPSDEIVIAATIRPTGHDSFLNKKNNGFSRS